MDARFFEQLDALGTLHPIGITAPTETDNFEFDVFGSEPALELHVIVGGAATCAINERGRTDNLYVTNPGTVGEVTRRISEWAAGRNFHVVFVRALNIGASVPVSTATLFIALSPTQIQLRPTARCLPYVAGAILVSAMWDGNRELINTELPTAATHDPLDWQATMMKQYVRLCRHIEMMGTSAILY